MVVKKIMLWLKHEIMSITSSHSSTEILNSIVLDFNLSYKAPLTKGHLSNKTPLTKGFTSLIRLLSLKAPLTKDHLSYKVPLTKSHLSYQVRF